jgi:hypothetical protein
MDKGPDSHTDSKVSDGEDVLEEKKDMEENKKKK